MQQHYIKKGLYSFMSVLNIVKTFYGQLHSLALTLGELIFFFYIIQDCN